MNTNYNIERSFLKIITQKEYYPFLKKELKKYIMHGNDSTFKHSRYVAYNSYKFGNLFSSKLNVNIDFDSLISSAYMHDFFMYDWHEKTTWHRLHGFTHAHVAAMNAQKYLNATSKEVSIIESHMWPLNITKIPKSREAWILTLCDKYTTILEVLRVYS